MNTADMAFDAMPGTARVWVFGAAAPVTGAAADALLSAVDDHLIRAAGVRVVARSVTSSLVQQVAARRSPGRNPGPR